MNARVCLFIIPIEKFHYRRVERNKIKVNKLERQTRGSTKANKIIDKALSPARETNVAEFHEQKIEDIQKRMKELQNMMCNLQKQSNKENDSYSSLFSVYTDKHKREKAQKKRKITNKKHHERRIKMRRDINQKTTEAKKEHIKNLSDHEMTRDQINLLSRGLNYIPTQVVNESHVRKELLKDFKAHTP